MLDDTQRLLQNGPLHSKYDDLAHGLIAIRGGAQLVVGIAQVGALIPGVSPSGSTLTTALALGFQRGTIARLFVGEAVLVTSVGALIGIGGALLIFNSIDLSLYIPNFQSFVPTAQTLLVAFFVSILVGLLSVSYSAYRISGMTIAEAMRSTE